MPDSEDPLAPALDLARSEVEAEGQERERKRQDAASNAAAALERDQRDRAQIELIGRSFLVAARAASLEPDLISFNVRRTKGIFRQERWMKTRRQGWVVRNWATPDNDDAGHDGIYVLDDGRIYSAPFEDRFASWDPNGIAQRCARYLAERGA
jgi:hypothetical protein